MRINLSISIVAVFCTNIALNASETTRLDDVQIVTSASGYEQKLVDAPASISVITQEDLQKKPYITLLDAIKDIEGVDIGETKDKTNNGTISIRGMGADYTLVLIDGKKQNNNGDIYPNSFGGTQYASIPPLSMVERIEIIRGPMSTLYGSDAIGGVVNIITKKISNEWVGAIGYSKTIQTHSDYGNNDNIDFSIMGPLVKDKFGLSLRGSLFNQAKSNPQYATVYDSLGVDRSKSNDSFGGGKGNVQSKNWVFGAGVVFTPSVHHTIKADFDIAKQKFDNKAYLSSSGNMLYPLGTGDSLATIWTNSRVGYADTLKMQREQYSLFWEADWDLGKSTVGVHHIVSENIGRSMPLSGKERQQLKANKANNPALPGYSANWSTFALAMADPDFLALMPREARTLESTNTIYSAKYELPLNKHYISVGAEHLDAQMKDGIFGMQKGESGAKKHYFQDSFFAEDNYSLLESLLFTVGLRYDKHEDFGDNLSPRAYLIYTLSDYWTLKGGIATGYKTPKTSDLQEGITGFGGQGTSPWVGNPNLKPEKSLSKEIALYYEYTNGNSFNITIFQNNFKDKIDSVTVADNQLAGSDYDGISTSFSQKQNVGKAEILGLEVAGTYYLIDTLSLKANWTFMDSKIKSDDWKNDKKPLSTSPKHMYNVMLNWQVTSKFSTYLQYLGEVDRFSRRYQKNNENIDLFYKDFSILNLGISYKLAKEFSIAALVNNLLDKDYLKYEFNDRVGTTNYYNEYNNKPSGRNFWLSARYSF